MTNCAQDDRKMIKQQSNIKFEISQPVLQSPEVNDSLSLTLSPIAHQKKKKHDQIVRSHRVNQETNLPLQAKSSSHCSLIETSIPEQIEKYLNKQKVNLETNENLNKLQKISDDVKLLTKQLQRSVEGNRNNNASSMLLDERLLGEICYQLERRILILIFSPLKHFYGYSLRYLSSIIRNESNLEHRQLYQERFRHIQTYLHRVNFDFRSHAKFTFSFINQYGIYFDYQWLQSNAQLLSNVDEIKSFCSTMCSSKDQETFEIILRSLQLISDLDGKPLFYW